jgi:outer membrane protein assembly factor BamB
MRKSLFASAFLIVLSVAWLIPQGVSAQSNPIFEADPFAKAPNIDVTWRRTLNEPPVWSYHSRELGAVNLCHTPAGRPALLVGTSSGELFRLNATTGETNWVTQLEGSIDGQPVVDDGVIFIGTNLGQFYALDTGDGSVEWSYEVDSPINTTAAVGDNTVYIADSGDVLRALNRKNGSVRWRYERQKPTSFTILGGGVPLVTDDLVLCGFADGRLVALNSESGNAEWMVDLSGDAREFFDADHQPISLPGDKDIVAASYNGGLYRISLRDGDIDWQRSVTGITDVIQSDGRLFVTSAGQRLYALDATSGEGLWKTKLSGYSPVGVAAVGFYLFVTTAEGPTYIIDRKTGYPFVKWDNAGGVSTPIQFGRKRGYLWSDQGVVYGFRVGY